MSETPPQDSVESVETPAPAPAESDPTPSDELAMHLGLVPDIGGKFGSDEEPAEPPAEEPAPIAAEAADESTAPVPPDALEIPAEPASAAAAEVPAVDAAQQELQQLRSQVAQLTELFAQQTAQQSEQSQSAEMAAKIEERLKAPLPDSLKDVPKMPDDLMNGFVAITGSQEQATGLANLIMPLLHRAMVASHMEARREFESRLGEVSASVPTSESLQQSVASTKNEALVQSFYVSNPWAVEQPDVLNAAAAAVQADLQANRLKNTSPAALLAQTAKRGNEILTQRASAAASAQGIAPTTAPKPAVLTGGKGARQTPVRTDPKDEASKQLVRNIGFPGLVEAFG